MSKTIEIKVPYYEKRKKLEKEFEIHITPNRFNVDYNEYIKKTAEVLKITSDYNNATTVDELNDVKNELDTMSLGQLLEDKYNLIKIMLKSNGYEYDRDFWDLQADPNDVNNFITDCAMKDQSDETKKKVLSGLLANMKS